MAVKAVTIGCGQRIVFLRSVRAGAWAWSLPQGQAEWPGGDHFIWQSVAVWDRGK